jgi:hypothetical protein
LSTHAARFSRSTIQKLQSPGNFCCFGRPLIEEIMMRRSILAVFATLLLFGSVNGVLAAGGSGASPLAAKAISENAGEAAAAIPELRRMGPAGLDALFTEYAEDIRQHAAGTDADPARWARIATALDQVAQQRNAFTSHLYWYTDLEQAKLLAAEIKRPILSLRLLGNLTDEFSCANSRFFRTALYANPAIADYLRANYILYWSSERAAPRITIDYGDGRKLERTITGNSIHYVLDANGAPVDALPGLYGPGAFLRELVRDAALVKSVSGKADDQRFALLLAYHQQRMKESTAAWRADLVAAGVNPRDPRLQAGQDPGAVDAAPRAITKAVVEFDVLKSITTDTRRLESLTDLQAWSKIASRHFGDAALHANSYRLIREEMFPGRVGPLPAGEANTLDAAIRKFMLNIALDTVRNEYLLRAQMHAWFVADGGYADLATLNSRVYAQLFLTPSTDPWLGLYAPDVYTGLNNSGVTNPR